MTKEQFDWIPFYTEFAEKILPYKDRRSELVQIIKEVYENIQMSLPKLEKDGAVDYSGPRAHLGRSSAQSDRASAHLPQSAL